MPRSKEGRVVRANVPEPNTGKVMPEQWERDLFEHELPSSVIEHASSKYTLRSRNSLIGVTHLRCGVPTSRSRLVTNPADKIPVNPSNNPRQIKTNVIGAAFLVLAACAQCGSGRTGLHFKQRGFPLRSESRW